MSSVHSNSPEVLLLCLWPEGREKNEKEKDERERERILASPSNNMIFCHLLARGDVLHLSLILRPLNERYGISGRWHWGLEDTFELICP